MGLISSLRARAKLRAAKEGNRTLRAGHELDAAAGLKAKVGRRAKARAQHILKLRKDAKVVVESDALANVADFRDAEARRLRLARANRPKNKKP